MYECVADNYDLFEGYEAELERLRRMRKRLSHDYGDYGMEDDGYVECER